MQNPWLQLPDSPPFISTTDAEPLGRLRGRLVGDYELKLDLLPQPWTGNVNTAEVFVLALNPGFRTEDHADLQNRDYAEQWRLALSVQTRTAFYFLDPAFRHTGGFLWWHRRMRDLIEVVGLDAVAQRVDTLMQGRGFYIVSGAQCIETPAGITVSRAGDSAIMLPGPPMTISGVGTENRAAVFLVLHDSAQPWIARGGTWTPSGRCPR